MIAGRFITKTELTGPALLALVNDILIEYPHLPTWKECVDEIKGFDMLEVITLRCNMMALSRAIFYLPYGMKFTFTPEEITRINIILDTWVYVADHKLPELNHFNMTEN